MKGKQMNANTIAELLAKLQAEAKEANENLEEATRIELESNFSDAMLSMDRTYAEGFAEALALAIRTLEEASK